MQDLQVCHTPEIKNKKNLQASLYTLEKLWGEKEEICFLVNI